MNINKIRFTLKHGRFLSGIYYFFFAMNCLDIVSIIMAAVIYAVTKEIVVLYACVFFAVCLLFFALGFVISYKQRKEVKEWLKDAVLLEAHITEADHYYFKFQRWSKICVMFRYDGKKYKKYSGGSCPRQSFGLTADEYSVKTGLKGGYDPRFYNAVGERKIYYSPKYDQVMILKRGKR